MPQIFLSYGSRDRALAVQVAAKLSERGLSIWYDDALLTGAAYRSAIRTAIETAQVVCVLWTAAAARSAWVKDEARNGERRGALFSVACGTTAVPAMFRRTVFGRIRRPEQGPSGSELSNLARGLSQMLETAGGEDQFSSRRLLSRLADYLSSSVIFGALIAVLVFAMSASGKPSVVSGPVALTVLSAVVGLAMGGVGFASSRFCDHLAVRHLSTSAGPSMTRLIYRWCGEAAGCAIPVMLLIVLKGRSAFFSVTNPHFVGYLMAGVLFSWLAMMTALALKYGVFMACTRCRYLLLT